MNKTYLKPNLQLFADGAIGDSGGTVGSAESVVQTGTAESQVAADTGANAPNADAEREANYKSMISGEYKDVHKKYMDKTFQRRFKEKDRQIADLEAYRDKVSAAFDKLSVKYGADPTDIDSILSAMDKDDSYLEEFAMEHNVGIEDAKTLIEAKRITNERAREKAQAEEEAQFQEQFNRWINESEQVKQFYPAFDFEYESTNEMTGDNFRKLLNSGVPVKAAFEVIHKDEIMGGAMQYAYQTAQKEMADQRANRQQRPVENGISEQQASAVYDDFSKLSKEQRKKIKAAATRGEKVGIDNFKNYL